MLRTRAWLRPTPRQPTATIDAVGQEECRPESCDGHLSWVRGLCIAARCCRLVLGQTQGKTRPQTDLEQHVYVCNV